MAVIFVLLALFNLFQIIHSQPECVTLYINIEAFGSSSIDRDNWNGVYTQTNKTSFGAPVWTIPGSDNNKWLKYIETHWVLIGQDNDLLIYNSSSTFPPTNTSSIWIHESETDRATLRLDCSDTLSPTSSPTPAPSTAPVTNIIIQSIECKDNYHLTITTNTYCMLQPTKQKSICT